MSQFIDRRALLAAVPAGAAAAVTLLSRGARAADAILTGKAPGDSQPRTGGMPLARYLQYVNLFNNDRDFYKEVHAHIHEKVEVSHYVADATGIAAELPSEFKVYKDWAEPNYFRRPLKAGEVFRVISLGMYQVDNGKFRHIKAARYKLVNDWRMEG
jgi:hypothetical protein